MRAFALRGAAVAGAVVVMVSACSGSDDTTENGSTGSDVSCRSDGVLKIGTVLPQSGNSAYLGPGLEAATALAVAQINDADGVLGEPVELFEGDSGDTTTNIAVVTADQHLQEGVDAVVGAASSEVTKSITEKLTSEGVLLISPADTAIRVADDNGLYFRTSPPDQFQGSVLADVARSDKVTSAAVLARQDSYGEDLAAAFTRSFTGSGGAMALDTVIYDPGAEDFATEVGKVAAASPEAVVLIGFAESRKIVQEMTKQGIGPDKVQLYLVDGNLSNDLYAQFPAGTMTGVKGTLPGAENSQPFLQQLQTVDPEVTDLPYSGEAYDAVNLVALAALAAGSDCGVDLASAMQSVSDGGTKCTTFSECAGLLADGQDIDYDGQSGPIAFDDNGDPSAGGHGGLHLRRGQQVHPDGVRLRRGPPAAGVVERWGVRPPRRWATRPAT